MGRVKRAAGRLTDPEDAEAVHDLRVAIRRLEASLYVWQDVLANKPLARTRKALRGLRRRAGAAREPEVHAAAVRHAMESAPVGLQESLTAIAIELTGIRDRKHAKLRARVMPWRMERLGRRLRRSLRPLTQPLGSTEAERLARARVEQRRRKALTALLDTRPEASDHALHDARLWVKRWRYAEESLATALGAEMAGRTLLQNLQQVLGEVQDLASLRDRTLALAAAQAGQGRPQHAAALAWLVTRAETERLAAVERFRSQPLPSGDAPPA